MRNSRQRQFKVVDHRETKRMLNFNVALVLYTQQDAKVFLTSSLFSVFKLVGLCNRRKLCGFIETAFCSINEGLSMVAVVIHETNFCLDLKNVLLHAV